jgi:hypothetical protein
MAVLSRLKNIFSNTDKDDSESLFLGDRSGTMDKPYRRVSFGVNKVSTPPPTEANPVRAASQKLMDLMSEPDEAQDKFDSYLADQPTEDQYRPSKKRRVGAALAGFGVGLTNPIAGIKIGQDIADEPYNKAVSDWTRKGKPLALAANQEQKGKTTRINMLKDYITAEHQANVEDYQAHNIAADNLRADLALAATNEERAAAQRRYEETERRLTDTASQAHNDRMTANERADRALKETTAQHEWERTHGNTMAEIAGRNATTNEGRATTYQHSVEGINAYRDYLKTKTDKATKPTKQTKELAEINTIMKPGNSQKYSDFYRQNEQGKFILLPPSGSDTDTLLQWAAFQKEINDEHNKIVTPAKPGVSVKPDDKPTSRFKREVVKQEKG